MTELQSKKRVYKTNRISHDNFIEYLEELICLLNEYSNLESECPKIAKLYRNYFDISKRIDRMLLDSGIEVGKRIFLEVLFSNLFCLDTENFISNRYDLMISIGNFPVNIHSELLNVQYYNMGNDDAIIKLIVDDFKRKSSKCLNDLEIAFSLDFFLTLLFSALYPMN